MSNIWIEFKTHQGLMIFGSTFIDLLLQVGLLTYFKTHLSFVLNNFLHCVQSCFFVVNKTPCLSRFFKKFNGYCNQKEDIEIVPQI